MSLTPNTKQTFTKESWIWWLLFPPYALYRYIRYSPMKWYIKVPVLLVMALTLVLSIDLALSPDRVEVAVATDKIEEFVEKELPNEELISVKRLGEGVSVMKDTVQLTVYYQLLTKNSLYHVGLVAVNDKDLMVHHVEQLFPIRQDIKGFENRTKGDVAIWLKANEAEIGTPLKLLEEDASESMQRVLTANGEYEFKYVNSHLYQVKDTKTDQLLLDTEQNPPLPEKIEKYLNKNEERVGKLTRVQAYELVDGVERHYLMTSEGNFMTESYPDGSIDISKSSE